MNDTQKVRALKRLNTRPAISTKTVDICKGDIIGHRSNDPQMIVKIELVTGGVEKITSRTTWEFKVVGVRSGRVSYPRFRNQEWSVIR